MGKHHASPEKVFLGPSTKTEREDAVNEMWPNLYAPFVESEFERQEREKRERLEKEAAEYRARVSAGQIRADHAINTWALSKLVERIPGSTWNADTLSVGFGREETGGCDTCWEEVDVINIDCQQTNLARPSWRNVTVEGTLRSVLAEVLALT